MVKKPTYEELKKRDNELEKSSFNHKHIEELLQKKSHEIQERVKELTCLYAISNLFENSDLSVEEILERTVNLLPTAWQYPEITCARIVLKHQVFQTNNFKETVWRQVSGITIDDDSIGAVEVYYLEERSDIDEGPFLQEERKLINAVAEKLGKIIRLKENVEVRGFRIEILDKAQEALNRLRQKSFDLILVNIFLPDSTGPMLISEMKTISPKAGIIAMTDRNSRELEMQIRRLDILYYMIRPIDIKCLTRLLDHVKKKSVSVG